MSARSCIRALRVIAARLASIGDPEWLCLRGRYGIAGGGGKHAGPVWAEARFLMRRGTQGFGLSPEVTEAAVIAVKQSVTRFIAGDFTPQRVPGKALPLMKQQDRVIDWLVNGSASILARLNAADGFPGWPTACLAKPVISSMPGPKLPCAANPAA